MPNIRTWKIIGNKVQCPYCKRLYDNYDENHFDHECEDYSRIISIESELETLVIHGIKELGEIAECLVKNQDIFDHWKDELGDLCAFSIRPMLELAEINFEDACKLGTERKNRKLKMEKNLPICRHEQSLFDI